MLRAADPSGVVPIVMSSAWRHTQRLEEIKRNFPKDISRRIVGVTPDLLEFNAAWTVSDAPNDAVPVTPRAKGLCVWLSRRASQRFPSEVRRSFSQDIALCSQARNLRAQPRRLHLLSMTFFHRLDQCCRCWRETLAYPDTS